MMRVVRIALLALSLVTGCEEVPEIRFVSDAATADDGGPTPKDGGADAAGCPEPAPAGATCCGTTWCTGCSPAQCTECAGKCVAGEVCCANPGTVNCRNRC